jgi:fatty acid desaturase
MESDGVSILGLLGLFLIVMFIWKGVRGAVDLIRQYNFIVIMLYFVVLTPLAFCHALFRGFTMKSEKELRAEAEAQEARLEESMHRAAKNENRQ